MIEVAALYVYLVCGDPVVIINEREIDGRYVSKAIVPDQEEPHLLHWHYQGVIEAIATDEVYIRELKPSEECIHA